MVNEWIIEKSIHSYKEIVNLTQADDLKSNFDPQFRLEDEKEN